MDKTTELVRNSYRFTRKEVLNKLRDMGIGPIDQSVLSDFTTIANWSAAAERERMVANGWRQCAAGQNTTQHCGLLEEAVAAERERCAEVCCTLERMRLDVFRNGGRLAEISPRDCAAAIRGRSEPS